MANLPTAQDPASVEKAQSRVLGLLQKITQLSTSGCSRDQLYGTLLRDTVSLFTGARGGVVWLSEADADYEPAYEVNLEELLPDCEETTQQQHRHLLRQVAAGGQPSLVLPHAQDNSGAVLNPTEYLLMICPLRGQKQVIGFVEIFLSPSSTAHSQQGNLQFLSQLVRLADDWYKNRLVESALEQREQWTSAADFARMVYRSLDVESTSFALANEARRMLQCDRVSVAVRRGGRYRLTAVSGQATVDRRSNVVVSLTALLRRALAAKEPLWYYGNTDDLPPEIERALQTYLDHSLMTSVVVIPLCAPAAPDSAESAGDRARREILGALVIEQASITTSEERLRQQVDLIKDHAGTALANAVEYDSIPLMPVWRLLRVGQKLVAWNNLPKTVLAVAAVAIIVSLLCFLPADFEVEARGQLTPESRMNVFAGVDGIVTSVEADHGDTVQKGDVLLNLQNTELSLRHNELIGEIDTTREKLSANERLMHDLDRMSLAERSAVTSERLSLTRHLEGLLRERELFEQRIKQLQVRSDIAGEVVTWDVKQRLLRRYVQPGQVLMTIIDPNRDWELEVHLPEGRLEDVIHAQAASGGRAKCTYVLASEPGVVREGWLVTVQDRVEPHQEGKQTARLRIEIDSEELPQKKTGMTALVKIDCGRRPLGYVWFHEVIDWVYMNILY